MKDCESCYKRLILEEERICYEGIKIVEI